MNCKSCIYEKCIKRTDKEFEICPVEVAKKEFEKSRSKQDENAK